jgi:hypothetical protein
LAMPKKAVELGALQVGRLAKPGRYAVGGVAGLQLWVSETGARSWVLRAMVGGKRKDMGLGGFPDVTLAGARDAARRARSQVAEGVDPVAKRRDDRARLAAENARARTFSQCSAAFFEDKSAEWHSDKHRQQWVNSLKNHADPVIGELFVRDITLAHVLDVVKPLWREKTETATRVLGASKQCSTGPQCVATGKATTLRAGEATSSSCYPSRARYQRSRTSRPSMWMLWRDSHWRCARSAALAPVRWSSAS